MSSNTYFGALNVPGNGAGFNILNPGPLNIGSERKRGFNPIDPSSFNLGEGFDFTLDAFADGEPVKGSYMQAQFSDNSQFAILSARMLVFMCSGFSTQNDSSVILLNLGWTNNFSGIHFGRGKKSVVNILSALKSQIDKTSIANAMANPSKSNDRLRQLLSNTSNDSSDFGRISEHKKISESIFTGSNTEEMSDELIEFWINFIEYMGSESVLLEIMNGSEPGSVEKYMMAYEPSSRTPQRSNDGFSELKKKTPVYLDSVLKHSSKHPFHQPLEKIDLIGEHGGKKYDVNTAKRLLNLTDVADLSTITDWSQLIDLETVSKKKQNGVFKQLLHQFVASRQIPMGYAYDPKTPVSLHLLFKSCHDDMFKFLGVVEDIMENKETRSIGGHQMFGTPPMTIVTERVVETSNIWGVPLKVGQPLYLVKTRRLISANFDEMANGAWMHYGKKHSQGGGKGLHYANYSSRKMSFRSNASDTWVAQNRTNNGFPPSSSENVSKKPQKKSGLVLDYGSDDKDSDDYDEKYKVELKDIRRGSINHVNWGHYSMHEKLKIAWNHYGEWVTLPVCGLLEQDLRKYYGYPDVFGRWNDPKIEKIGLVRSVDETLQQNTDAVRQVVSGMSLDSKNPLTREEMLNKTSMLDYFSINLNSKLQNKMAM